FSLTAGTHQLFVRGREGGTQVQSFAFKGGPTCSCDGKTCGEDGCGHSCGTCAAGKSCVANACVSNCGNGELDPGETCDGNCPTSCDDGNSCTSDTLSGTPATCDVACSHSPVTACANGDGCCAPGCTNVTDSDCNNPTSKFKIGDRVHV